MGRNHEKRLSDNKHTQEGAHNFLKKVNTLRCLRARFLAPFFNVELFCFVVCVCVCVWLRVGRRVVNCTREEREWERKPEARRLYLDDWINTQGGYDASIGDK